MKAYVEWSKGEKTLYLEKDGKKEIIKTQLKYFNQKKGKYSWLASLGSIYGLEFKGEGELLKYEIGGYEFHGILFYNLKNSRIINEGYLSNYGITKDNKFIYICGESGMSGGSVKVYNYPDLTLYKDLYGTGNSLMISNCYSDDGYDSEKNILKYELENNKYEYNFDTNDILQK